jgi:glycosyltransferase involved in cell wall biosynthesis
LIQTTIRGVPLFVDTILVVDDASTDRTRQVVTELSDRRTRLLYHSMNRGVGAAIYTGYSEALALGADVLVVMAGDNQMDGADLHELLKPIWDERASYVKGNRHLHPNWNDMPRLRRIGTRVLAWFTSFAMGMRVGDSQCGYTALSRSAASSLDFSELWTGYGYPNDLLITLARRGFAIAEVAVRPVYQDEASGLRPWHIFTISGVILRSWWRERRSVLRKIQSYSNEQLIG